MTRAHFVKRARKDYPEHDIKRGEPYYWWQFKFHAKQYSKTQPKPSQLTQSSFWQSVYSIQESIERLTPDDLTGGDISDITSQIEDLRSETEDKLSNMPDQLQAGDTGQLLQERIDGLQGWQDELEGVSIPDQVDEPDEIEEPVEVEKPEVPEGENITDEQREEYEEKCNVYDEYQDKLNKYNEYIDEMGDYEQYESDLEAALEEIQGAEYSGS